jgi:hypothetical protein
LRDFALQLSDATELHMKTNSQKFSDLNYAMGSLMVDIIATILWGIIVLLTDLR